MQRMLFILALVINCVLVYSIVFSDRGVFAYLEARDRHELMVAQVEELDRKSVVLSQEIRLLRDDRDYLERVIRQQMPFVEEGEVLYVFPKPSDEDVTGTLTGAQGDG